MKLIDKDKVISILSSNITHIKLDMKCGFLEERKGTEKILVLKHIISLVNTLEVKDVDLEKEFESFLDNIEGVPRMWHSDEQIVWAKDIAKHFFKLGLSIAQPHITMPNIDDILKEGGVEPNSKVAKMFKESYYKALDNTLHKGE